MRLSIIAAVAALGLCLFAGAVQAAASAVAVSPERTSVEADFSQVFSARFLDASGHPAVGETVQFSNDACGRFANGSFVAGTTTDSNGIASMTFTAMQPGGVVCAVVAAAGAQVRFQVYTYRLAQLSIVAPLPSNATSGSAFELPVEIHMGAYALPNVDIGARVIAGTGSATVSPTSTNTGLNGVARLMVTPSGLGDFDVEINVRTLARRVAVRYVSPTEPASGPHQDMWWSGPAENGWGLSIVEHRNVLFVLVYAYDANGLPRWYVISDGSWSGPSYTGAIYSPRGTPFYAYDGSRLAMGAPVGSGTLTFADADHATFDYTIDGIAGRKEIRRFLFGPPAIAPMTQRTDMWWGGVSQGGWGIAVIQQNALLFLMWYTYDASGMPLWYAMTSGNWTAGDTFEGRVHRATGSPWLGRTYDATLFNPLDVGSFRLRFSGDTAVFDYSVDGRSGSLPLTRTPF